MKDVRVEVVAHVLKRPYARVGVRDARLYEIGEVRKLMDGLRDAIAAEQKDYFLGTVAVEWACDDTLRLHDGRKRLLVVALLLDRIRQRLSGATPKRRQGFAKEAK